jgi:hypothetical protein
VLLTLNTLAEGGEVIISRGELVEIGGSFRIPDVIAKSGARLREVGTTNRTRLSDYEQAINDRDQGHPSRASIKLPHCRLHRESPPSPSSPRLARAHNLPFFEDQGSGCLIDLQRVGIHDEPTVAASLAAGVSVVAFSGDKLLGGPQCGIILGEPELHQTDQVESAHARAAGRQTELCARSKRRLPAILRGTAKTGDSGARRAPRDARTARRTRHRVDRAGWPLTDRDRHLTTDRGCLGRRWRLCTEIPRCQAC